MCPVTPPLSADTSDEKVVIFLDSRKAEDPIPSNVITDVDPFTVDPRISSGNDWYMHKSIVSDIHNEASIIKGKGGYWEFIDDIIILTTTPTVGKKITRKFYLGEETSGGKTAFRMKVYYVEHENNEVKECLSRIFSDDVNNEEHNTGSESTKSKLQCIANQQGGNSSLKQCENEFQASEENEAQSELRNDQMNEEEGYDGDFLELKDIYGPEDTVSFFSGYTSVTSDDLSEPEITGPNKEKAVTSNIADNGPGQGVIRPPLSLDDTLVAKDAVLASSVPFVQPQNESDESTSSSSEGGGDTSAKHSGSGSSSKRTKSRSARRMAKLGKRYCCFS